MKKLISALTASAIFLTLTITGNAVTISSDLATAIPATAGLFVSFNPDNLNSTLKNKWEELMESTFSSIDQQVTTEFIVEKASSNQFGIFYEIDSTFTKTPAIFLQATEAEFQENIADILEAEGTTWTESENIYCNGYSDCYAYIDGYIFLANNEDYFRDLEIRLVEDSVARLSENREYEKLKDQVSSNNFAESYIFKTMINDLYSDFYYYESPEDINTIESLAFSAEITGNTLTVDYTGTFDEDKLAEMGLDTTSSANISLFEYLPNKSPIYFADQTYAEDTFEKSLQLVPEWEEIEAEMFEATGLTFSKDLLGLFGEELAISIYDESEMIPGVTMLTDVSSNPEAAQDGVELLIDKLWTTLEQEGSKFNDQVIIQNNGTKFTLTKEDIEIGSSNLIKISINFTDKKSKNPYAQYYLNNALDFEITLGITDDDILLLSNDPNIATTYGDGLNPSKVNSVTGKNATSVGYFDMGNLSKYIQNMMAEFVNTDNNSEAALDNFNQKLNQALGFIDYLSSYGNSTSEEFDGSLEIKFDTNNFVNIVGNFELLFDAADNLTFKNNEDFSDVDTTEWYGDDVYYLSSEGVVKGYYDGTYKPGQEMNRAEFITIVVNALETKNLVEEVCPKYSKCEGTTTYSDLDTYDWYASPIYTAQLLGIVDGYSDGTFKPESIITKSEAAQVLLNVIEKYPTLTEHLSNKAAKNFSDVAEKAWYRNAVQKMSQYGIVDGTNKGTFEPGKTLNRAECAKMIRKTFF